MGISCHGDKSNVNITDGKRRGIDINGNKYFSEMDRQIAVAQR